MDRRTREQARLAAGGDLDAALFALRSRMRAGRVSRERVHLAARLGHELGKTMFPDASPVDWSISRQSMEAIAEAASLAGVPAVIHATIDWCENRLPIWEAELPAYRAPHKALAAARAWANHPTKELAQRASSVHLLFEHPSGAPHSWVGVAVNALIGAMKHVENPALLAFHLQTISTYIATTCFDVEWEREWQRLRLAAYVLGEAPRGEAT